MIPFKPKTVSAAKFSALLATAFFSTTVAGLAQIPEDQISPAALKQITKILKTKGKFTAAEAKISSNIALASRQARFEPIGGTDKIIDRTNITTDGLASVKITGKVNKAVKALIAANGGTITSVDKGHGEIMAKLPLAALPTVAESDEITSVDEPDIMINNVGAVTSQAYVGHKAKNVVEGLGIDGTGIKVGVLSDSASPGTVAALQASGDLPAAPNTVVINPGSGADMTTIGTGENEGSAIMEIIHDMAPGAQIYFNTGTTVATFASAITALGAAGCTVIIDDIGFANEGVFQDDTIAQAINAFVASGPGNIYFSSSANSGNLASGTSGTWEGDFLAGGATATPVSTTDPAPAVLHNFGTAAAPVLYDTITVAAPRVTLKWSDPLTGGLDDYDLFVLNAAGTTVIKSSVSRQTGTRAPYEICSATATDAATGAVDFPVGSRVVVVQYNGTTAVPKTTLTRALHLDANRGSFQIGTTGSTFGHNAGANTQSVAATFWNSGKLGASSPFNGTNNPVELFSSDGPRKIFYNPDGTQIGTGSPVFANAAAGISLLKPDFTAADGVTCHTAFTPLATGSIRTVPFSPFFGTSAAAPHAASIAALMQQAKPGITNTQIHNILVNTAMDNMSSFNTLGNYDPAGGYGVLDALAAVQAAKLLP